MLEIPVWQGKMIFDYPCVSFMLVIALLTGGLALCFMGYKYLHTMCVVILSCCLAMVALSISDYLLKSAVFKMYFVVTVTFAGATVLCMISGRIISALRKRGAYDNVLRKQYLVAAPLGAFSVGACIYYHIYRELWICAGIGVILTVTGMIWGRWQAARQIIFYTYEDMRHRKPILGKGVGNRMEKGK